MTNYQITKKGKLVMGGFAALIIIAILAGKVYIAGLGLVISIVGIFALLKLIFA